MMFHHVIAPDTTILASCVLDIVMMLFDHVCTPDTITPGPMRTPPETPRLQAWNWQWWEHVFVFGHNAVADAIMQSCMRLFR